MIKYLLISIRCKITITFCCSFDIDTLIPFDYTWLYLHLIKRKWFFLKMTLYQFFHSTSKQKIFGEIYPSQSKQPGPTLTTEVMKACADIWQMPRYVCVCVCVMVSDTSVKLAHKHTHSHHTLTHTHIPSCTHALAHRGFLLQMRF